MLNAIIGRFVLLFTTTQRFNNVALQCTISVIANTAISSGKRYMFASSLKMIVCRSPLRQSIVALSELNKTFLWTELH